VLSRSTGRRGQVADSACEARGLDPRSRARGRFFSAPIGYLSPEQLMGSTVDPRRDVFSLGRPTCTAILITGISRGKATTAEILRSATRSRCGSSQPQSRLPRGGGLAAPNYDGARRERAAGAR